MPKISPGQDNISANAYTGKSFGDLPDLVVNNDMELSDVQDKYTKIGKQLNNATHVAAKNVGARQQSLVGNNFGATNPYMYNTYYEPAGSAVASAMRVEGANQAFQEGMSRGKTAAEQALADAKAKYSSSMDALNNAKTAYDEYSYKNPTIAQVATELLGEGTTVQEFLQYAQANNMNIDDLIGQTMTGGTNYALVKDWGEQDRRTNAATNPTLEHFGHTREEYDKWSQEEKDAFWGRSDVGNYWSKLYADSYIKDNYDNDTYAQYQDFYNQTRAALDTVMKYINGDADVDKGLDELLDALNKSGYIELEMPTFQQVVDGAADVIYLNDIGFVYKNADGQYEKDLNKDIDEFIKRLDGEDKEAVKMWRDTTEGIGFSFINNFSKEKRLKMDRGRQLVMQEFAGGEDSVKSHEEKTTVKIDIDTLLGKTLGIDIKSMMQLRKMQTDNPDQYDALLRQATGLISSVNSIDIADGEKWYKTANGWEQLEAGTAVMYAYPGSEDDKTLKELLQVMSDLNNSTLTKEQKEQLLKKAEALNTEYMDHVKNAMGIENYIGSALTGDVYNALLYQTDPTKYKDLVVDGRKISDVIAEWNKFSKADPEAAFQRMGGIIRAMNRETGTYYAATPQFLGMTEYQSLPITNEENGRELLPGAKDDYRNLATADATALFMILSSSIAQYNKGTKTGNVDPAFLAADGEGFLSDAIKVVARETQDFVDLISSGLTTLFNVVAPGEHFGDWEYAANQKALSLESMVRSVADTAALALGKETFEDYQKNITETNRSWNDLWGGELNERSWSYSRDLATLQQENMADVMNPFIIAAGEAPEGIGIGQTARGVGFWENPTAFSNAAASVVGMIGVNAVENVVEDAAMAAMKSAAKKISQKVAAQIGKSTVKALGQLDDVAVSVTLFNIGDIDNVINTNARLAAKGTIDTALTYSDDFFRALSVMINAGDSSFDDIGKVVASHIDDYLDAKDAGNTIRSTLKSAGSSVDDIGRAIAKEITRDAYMNLQMATFLGRSIDDIALLPSASRDFISNVITANVSRDLGEAAVLTTGAADFNVFNALFGTGGDKAIAYVNGMSRDGVKATLNQLVDQMAAFAVRGAEWTTDDTIRFLGRNGWDSARTSLLRKGWIKNQLQMHGENLLFNSMEPELDSSGNTVSTTPLEYLSNPLNYITPTVAGLGFTALGKIFNRVNLTTTSHALDKAMREFNAAKVDGMGEKAMAIAQKIQRLEGKLTELSNKALDAGRSYDEIQKFTNQANDAAMAAQREIEAGALWDIYKKGGVTEYKNKEEFFNAINDGKVDIKEELFMGTRIAAAKAANSYYGNATALGRYNGGLASIQDRGTNLGIAQAMHNVKKARYTDIMKMEGKDIWEKMDIMYGEMKAAAVAEYGKVVIGLDNNLNEFFSRLKTSMKEAVDNGSLTEKDIRLGYMPYQSYLNPDMDGPLALRNLFVAQTVIDPSTANPFLSRGFSEDSILEALAAGKTETTLTDMKGNVIKNADGSDKIFQLNLDGGNFLDRITCYQNGFTGHYFNDPVFGKTDDLLGETLLKNKSVVIQGEKAMEGAVKADIDATNKEIGDIVGNADKAVAAEFGQDMTLEKLAKQRVAETEAEVDATVKNEKARTEKIAKLETKRAQLENRLNNAPSEITGDGKTRSVESTRYTPDRVQRGSYTDESGQHMAFTATYDPETNKIKVETTVGKDVVKTEEIEGTKYSAKNVTKSKVAALDEEFEARRTSHKNELNKFISNYKETTGDTKLEKFDFGSKDLIDIYSRHGFEFDPKKPLQTFESKFNISEQAKETYVTVDFADRDIIVNKPSDISSVSKTGQKRVGEPREFTREMPARILGSNDVAGSMKTWNDSVDHFKTLAEAYRKGTDLSQEALRIADADGGIHVVPMTDALLTHIKNYVKNGGEVPRDAVAYLALGQKYTPAGKIDKNGHWYVPEAKAERTSVLSDEVKNWNKQTNTGFKHVNGRDYTHSELNKIKIVDSDGNVNQAGLDKVQYIIGSYIRGQLPKGVTGDRIAKSLDTQVAAMVRDAASAGGVDFGTVMRMYDSIAPDKELLDIATKSGIFKYLNSLDNMGYSLDELAYDLDVLVTRASMANSKDLDDLVSAKRIIDFMRDQTFKPKSTGDFSVNLETDLDGTDKVAYSGPISNLRGATVDPNEVGAFEYQSMGEQAGIGADLVSTAKKGRRPSVVPIAKLDVDQSRATGMVEGVGQRDFDVAPKAPTQAPAQIETMPKLEQPMTDAQARKVGLTPVSDQNKYGTISKENVEFDDSPIFTREEAVSGINGLAKFLNTLYDPRSKHYKNYASANYSLLKKTYQKDLSREFDVVSEFNSTVKKLYSSNNNVRSLVDTEASARKARQAASGNVASSDAEFDYAAAFGIARPGSQYKKTENSAEIAKTLMAREKVGDTPELEGFDKKYGEIRLQASTIRGHMQQVKAGYEQLSDMVDKKTAKEFKKKIKDIEKFMANLPNSSQPIGSYDTFENSLAFALGQVEDVSRMIVPSGDEILDVAPSSKLGKASLFTPEQLDSVYGENTFEGKMKNTGVILASSSKDTANKAAEIGGIDTLRHPDKNGMHFGNPFSPEENTRATVKTKSIAEAVDNYRKWLKGEAFQDVEPERRQWIVNQINSGELKGKPLVYYTDDVPGGDYFGVSKGVEAPAKVEAPAQPDNIMGIPVKNDAKSPYVTVVDVLDTVDKANDPGYKALVKKYSEYLSDGMTEEGENAWTEYASKILQQRMAEAKTQSAPKTAAAPVEAPTDNVRKVSKYDPKTAPNHAHVLYELINGEGSLDKLSSDGEAFTMPVYKYITGSDGKRHRTQVGTKKYYVEAGWEFRADDGFGVTLFDEQGNQVDYSKSKTLSQKVQDYISEKYEGKTNIEEDTGDIRLSEQLDTDPQVLREAQYEDSIDTEMNAAAKRAESPIDEFDRAYANYLASDDSLDMIQEQEISKRKRKTSSEISKELEKVNEQLKKLKGTVYKQAEVKPSDEVYKSLLKQYLSKQDYEKYTTLNEKLAGIKSKGGMYDSGNGATYVDSVEGLKNYTTLSNMKELVGWKPDQEQVVEEVGSKADKKATKEMRKQMSKNMRTGETFYRKKKDFELPDMDARSKGASLEQYKALEKQIQAIVGAVDSDQIYINKDMAMLLAKVSEVSLKPSKFAEVMGGISAFNKFIQEQQLAGGASWFNALTIAQVRGAIMADPFKTATYVKMCADMKNSAGVRNMAIEMNPKLTEIGLAVGDMSASTDLLMAVSKRPGIDDGGVIQSVVTRALESGGTWNGPKAIKENMDGFLKDIFNDATFQNAIPVLRAKMLVQNYDNAIRVLKKRFPGMDEAMMKKQAAKMSYSRTEAFFNPGRTAAKGGMEGFLDVNKTRLMNDEMNRIVGIKDTSKTFMDVAREVFFAMSYKMMLAGRVYMGALGVVDDIGGLRHPGKLDITAENLNKVGTRFMRQGGANTIYTMGALAVVSAISCVALGIPTAWDDVAPIDPVDGEPRVPPLLQKFQTIGQIWLPNAYDPDTGFYVDKSKKMFGVDTMSSIFTLQNSLAKFGDRIINPNAYSQTPQRGLPFLGVNNPINKALNSNISKAFGDELLAANLLSPYRAVYEILMDSTYFGNNIWEKKYLPDGSENKNYDPMRNIIASGAHLLGFDKLLSPHGYNDWVKGKYLSDGSLNPKYVDQDRIGTVSGSGLLQHEYVTGFINFLEGDYLEGTVEAGEIPLKTKNLASQARTEFNNTVKNTIAQYMAEYKYRTDGVSNDEKDAIYADIVKKCANVVANWSAKWDYVFGDDQSLVPYATRVLMMMTAGEYDDNMQYLQNAIWKAENITNIEHGQWSWLDDEELTKWIEEGHTVEEFNAEKQRRVEAYNKALDDEYMARNALRAAGYSEDLLEQFSTNDLKSASRAVSQKVYTGVMKKLESPVGEFKNFKEMKSYYEAQIDAATTTQQKAKLANQYNTYVTDVLAPYVKDYGEAIINDAYYNGQGLANSLADYIILPADKYYRGKSPRASYLKDLFGVGYKNSKNLPSDAEVIELFSSARSQVQKGATASAVSILDRVIDQIKAGRYYANDLDYSKIVNLKALLGARSN